MSRQRRLVVAAAINVAIIVVQVVFGFRAHSLGLLADAGHNFTDVGALGLSLWAVHLSRRTPNPKQSYGFHRSGILAAQANAALILVATVFIVVEGVRRLFAAPEVHGLVVVIVAAIALIGNSLSVVVLSGHDGDLNMRSAVLHMAGDAAASAGVIVAGLIITLTDGTFWLDPLVSIAVGLMISWRAVRLLVETNDILMEATPGSVDVHALTAALQRLDGVDGVHDLHVWSLSGSMHAMSAHLVVHGSPTLQDAQVIGQRAKDLAAHEFAISHATVELECDPCARSADPCLPVDASVPHEHHH